MIFFITCFPFRVCPVETRTGENAKRNVFWFAAHYKIKINRPVAVTADLRVQTSFPPKIVLLVYNMIPRHNTTYTSVLLLFFFFFVRFLRAILFSNSSLKKCFIGAASGRGEGLSGYTSYTCYPRARTFRMSNRELNRFQRAARTTHADSE